MAQPLNPALPVKPIYDKVFTFRIRKHVEDSSFRGLWDLDVINQKGQITNLCHADALPFCIENMQGFLESEGF